MKPRCVGAKGYDAPVVFLVFGVSSAIAKLIDITFDDKRPDFQCTILRDTGARLWDATPPANILSHIPSWGSLLTASSSQGTRREVAKLPFKFSPVPALLN